MVVVSETMSIGEYASQTGLSISALRFYDRQGLLSPAEVDPATGYRRYRRSQLSDGLLVCDLRRLDMPLAEIAAALERDPAERRALIQEHLDRLDRLVARAHAVAQELGVLRSADDGSYVSLVMPIAG